MLMAKTCSPELQLPPHDIHDARVRLPRRSARVDEHHSPLFPLRDRQIAFVHTHEKSPRLLLEPVLISVPAFRVSRITLIAPPRPAYTGARVRVEQNGQIGLQIPAQD